MIVLVCFQRYVDFSPVIVSENKTIPGMYIIHADKNMPFSIIIGYTNSRHIISLHK